jgi:hypothetical protein
VTRRARSGRRSTSIARRRADPELRLLTADPAPHRLGLQPPRNFGRGDEPVRGTHVVVQDDLAQHHALRSLTAGAGRRAPADATGAGCGGAAGAQRRASHCSGSLWKSPDQHSASHGHTSETLPSREGGATKPASRGLAASRMPRLRRTGAVFRRRVRPLPTPHPSSPGRPNRNDR